MAKINAFSRRKGWIEVICGPMFAGKSEELLRRLNLLKYSEVNYFLFKHQIDIRNQTKKVTSRDGRKMEAIVIQNSHQILDYIRDCTTSVQVIAIDEIQFFDQEIVNICVYLANNGYIVICSGLDLDYLGKPFYNTMHLLAHAEKVTKLSAICVDCGANANFSDKLIPDQKLDHENNPIIVGDAEVYTVKCRHCFSRKNELNKIYGSIKKPG